jgi:hypothetical protein
LRLDEAPPSHPDRGCTDVPTSIEAAPTPVARTRTDGWALAAGLAGAAVSGLIALLAIRDRAGADFGAHIALTKRGLSGGSFPGDVLFYWLEAVMAGFRPVDRRLYAGLIAMLAVAGGVKAYLTARLIESRVGAVLALLCLFAFGLPFGPDYPAFIPPNVWHNSTTALLMPLAIGLFLASLAYLHEPRPALLWLMLLLLVLNILAKPSFALCWLVVFPIAVLVAKEKLLGPAVVTGAGGALLLAQYVYVYVAERGNPYGDGSGVRFAPLHTWSFYAPNLAWSFVASYAFPITALVLGGAAVRRDGAVRFATALAAVGLLWFALVGETGHQEYHGNFMWQAIVTNYLLFAALVAALLRADVRGWRRLVLLGVFALHLAGGVQYLVWWLTYNAP